MKAHVSPLAALPAEHWAVWADLHDRTDCCASAFFSPDFATAVDAARGGIEVAVLEDRNEVIAVLPFERSARRIGLPVGSTVSEIHGPIARPGAPLDIELLLRTAGLREWRFGCSPVAQSSFGDYAFVKRELPVIDIGSGFRTYADERRAAGSSVLRQTRRKAKKFERECGTLRFETHTADAAVLESLLRWKSAHYQRTGTHDVLSLDWVRELVTRLAGIQSEGFAARSAGFAGMLSALFVGDELAAVHMGIRSRTVWSWWFPTYNPKFAAYSPGTILLAEMIQAAPGIGIQRIELGQGPESYKARFASHAMEVCEGSLGARSVSRSFHAAWVKTRDWVGESPLAAWPLRTFRAVRNSRVQA